MRVQVAGVVVSLLYVDSAGRRPLMVWGGCGCAASLSLMALANHLRSSAFILVAMCLFLFAFSASYGTVTHPFPAAWVLPLGWISDIYALRSIICSAERKERRVRP
jgi:MFS family permease